MADRIFTFGCSFTEYVWPTWADMILYGNEGHNVGIRGSGNESILYRLLETDRKYKLNQNDTIIILFTTPIRWDLIISNNSEWGEFGQVTSSSLSKYENELYTIDGLIFKSMYSITLIKDFLDKKNVKYLFGSVNNLYENYGNYFENFKLSNELNSLVKITQSNVNLHLQDFHSYLYRGNFWVTTKKWDKGADDYHPRPISHYKWIRDVLLKHMDIDLKITENDVLKIESNIDKIKTMNECEIFFKNEHNDLVNRKLTKKIYL
jgi:hypothetical protein